MAIDVETEELMTLRQATTRIPGRKRVHINTMHRWRLTGYHGVKLECLRIGGTEWMTSREALLRFIESLNPQQPVAPETEARRAKRNAAVKEELYRLGVGTRPDGTKSRPK
jgi:hypothetical protein